MKIGRLMRGDDEDQRGFAVLSTCFLLSALMLYASVMSMRVLTQQRVETRLRQQEQALQAAQSAAEQLKEHLYFVLRGPIYQRGGEGQWGVNDPQQAFAWLDALPAGTENPPFDIPLGDTNGDGAITLADGDGTPDGRLDQNGAGAPAVPPLTLPTLHADRGDAARAWIVAVTDPGTDPAARQVTLMGEARIGNSTKRVRVTYEIALGTSDVLRYAYYAGNLGWFDLSGDAEVEILGEVGASNLQFTGNTGSAKVMGDLYASANSALGMTGTITGDPGEWSGLSEYWRCRDWEARPAQPLVFPDQPAIGGTPITLDPGVGWDSANPDQTRYEAQEERYVPYVAGLEFYRPLAAGSSLTYNADLNGDGDFFNDGAEGRKTLLSEYDVANGPDQLPDTWDDGMPLILYGKSSKPIQISGPVVVPGDVIIRGWVTGQGTIYAGRNVHIAGQIHYLEGSDIDKWVNVERDQTTGQVREVDGGNSLGTICNNGVFYGPAETPPAGCMQ